MSAPAIDPEAYPELLRDDSVHQRPQLVANDSKANAPEVADPELYPELARHDSTHFRPQPLANDSNSNAAEAYHASPAPPYRQQADPAGTPQRTSTKEFDDTGATGAGHSPEPGLERRRAETKDGMEVVNEKPARTKRRLELHLPRAAASRRTVRLVFVVHAILAILVIALGAAFRAASLPPDGAIMAVVWGAWNVINSLVQIISPREPPQLAVVFWPVGLPHTTQQVMEFIADRLFLCYGVATCSATSYWVSRIPKYINPMPNAFPTGIPLLVFLWLSTFNCVVVFWLKSHEREGSKINTPEADGKHLPRPDGPSHV